MLDPRDYIYYFWYYYSTYLIIAGVVALIALIVAIWIGWRILSKAGEKGWKALIPVYGRFCLDKVAGGTAFAVIRLVITGIALILNLLIALQAYSMAVLVIDLVVAILLFVTELVFLILLAQRFGFPVSFPAISAACTVISSVISFFRPVSMSMLIAAGVLTLISVVLTLIEVFAIAFSSKYEYGAARGYTPSSASSSIYGEYNFRRDNAENNTQTIWTCPSCGRTNRDYYCSYCGHEYTGKGKKVDAG